MTKTVEIPESCKGHTPERIATYLRSVADAIESNPQNQKARMAAEVSSPKSAWYEPGEVSPQGFLYAGDVTININIVLPRRIGERTS
jgi:hypothetical protein